jgi:histidine triad (HIT) family protein
MATEPGTQTTNDPNCIFCKIIAGEIPAEKVSESEQAFAFRDLQPVAPTHILVVPKRHIVAADRIVATDGPDVAALFVLGQEVARLEGLANPGAERGYRLVFNVGPDSGNSVGHLHMHVVGGQAMGWPPFAG